jgi:hypothetical protein
MTFALLSSILSEAKSKVPDWGDKVDSGIGIKVDSGIGIKVDSGIALPMVNVLESTLEWT